VATGIRHGYRLVTIPAELSFLGRGTPYPKVTGLEELIPNTDSHHRQQAQFVTFDQCLFGRSNPDRDNVLGPGARDTYLKFNSSREWAAPSGCPETELFVVMQHKSSLHSPNDRFVIALHSPDGNC
jgi:hypothetical protein